MSEDDGHTPAPMPLTPPPERLTSSGAKCFDGYVAVLNFLLFIASLAIGADRVRVGAAEALLEGAKDEAERARYEETLGEGRTATVDTLRKEHVQLLREMAVARIVDNFLTYVAELMSEVFKHRPETLRSAAQVRVDYVLSFETLDDLVETLAEREVERLAYAGRRQLNSELTETLAFPLFDDETRLTRAVRLVEARNLIVHNRGVINRTYLSRVDVPAGQLGEKLRFGPSIDYLLAEFSFLSETAVAIDGRAFEKWGLVREPYKPPSSKVVTVGPEGRATPAEPN